MALKHNKIIMRTYYENKREAAWIDFQTASLYVHECFYNSLFFLYHERFYCTTQRVWLVDDPEELEELDDDELDDDELVVVGAGAGRLVRSVGAVIATTGSISKPK